MEPTKAYKVINKFWCGGFSGEPGQTVQIPESVARAVGADVELAEQPEASEEGQADTASQKRRKGAHQEASEEGQA